MAKRRRRRNKNKGLRLKARTRLVRRRARRAVRRAARKTRTVVRTVTRYVRRSRKMSKKKGRGGAVSRSRAGFLNKDVAFAIGGSVAAGVITPMVQRMLPASMSPALKAIAGVAIAFGGYMLLKKFSAPGALGFAAAAGVSAIRPFLPASLQGYGLGNFYADGNDALPGGGMGEYLLADEYDLNGLGQYTDEAVMLV